MGQQVIDLTVLLGGQAREHIPQVDIGVMAIQASRLNQTHDGRRTLARPELPRKKPVTPTQGDGTNLVLDVVVVDGQLGLIDKTRQRRPAL